NQFHGGEPLSLAIGMATARDGERLEQAIHRADAQMYAAKREHYALRQHDRRGTTQWGSAGRRARPPPARLGPRGRSPAVFRERGGASSGAGRAQPLSRPT